jgi:antitoxin component of MazEF toxin-antitoxin module
MSTQIARIDGTVTVEIPEELLKKANLSVGDPVEWILTTSGTLALRSPHPAAVDPTVEDYEQWKAQEIEAGFAGIEGGDGVPNEKVIQWLSSWASTNELPPPA